tara:strand:- start:667 stop:2343 length:1677 start_codon:yes stop_codon:yes gene_type:complete
MRKILLLLLPFFLWTCSEGPTEPKAPLAYNLSLTTNEDTALTFTFEDISSSSAISISRNTKNGTLTLSGSSATYTPNDDFNGTDTFSYIVIKNGLNSNTANAEITVLPVNDAPVIVNDERHKINEFFKNDSWDITIYAEDKENSNLSFKMNSQPQLGAAYINGNILTYTANNIGLENLSISVSDGELQSEGTVEINIIEDYKTFNMDNSKVLYLEEKIFFMERGGYATSGNFKVYDLNEDLISQYSEQSFVNFTTFQITSDNHILFSSNRHGVDEKIFKFDVNGNLVWEKQTNKLFSSFHEHRNGKYIFIGNQTNSESVMRLFNSGNGEENGAYNYLIKIPNNELYKHFNDRIFAIHVDNLHSDYHDDYFDGDMIVFFDNGEIHKSNGHHENASLILELNPNGSIVSATNWKNNGYLLAEISNDYYKIHKIDSDFNHEWEKTTNLNTNPYDSDMYKYSHRDYYYNECTIIEINQNEFYFIAKNWNEDTSWTFNISKRDSDGSVIWSKTIPLDNIREFNNAHVAENESLFLSFRYAKGQKRNEHEQLLLLFDSSGNRIF